MGTHVRTFGCCRFKFNYFGDDLLPYREAELRDLWAKVVATPKRLPVRDGSGKWLAQNAAMDLIY